MAKISINRSKLDKLANKTINKMVEPVARKMVEKVVEESQQKMLKEFESHPVTKEIEMGPEGYNVSGTLGGYGNLYSYIGFEEGMDPIAPVRHLLSKAIKIKRLPTSSRKLMINFLVELPSKEEIAQKSPMPWQNGRSWIIGIEQGISGLNNYLNKESFSSRSGYGVQAKKAVRSGSFSNTKYLSMILRGLEKNIRSLTK